ncbi:MAG: glycerophosphodiester phosphodiesterase family protein [Halieaceae bacterium]|jgi:glycerophosphoryl diester phosphodiesterase|nr:glycerophosphodiester phosphodiesterase family protein [Halieaceae bacterium]
MTSTRITAALLALALLQACSDGSNGPAVTPSSLTVVPTAAPEGAPGEMNILRFRVTLTEPQGRDVNVSYETSAGTATAGEDYLDTAGDISIPAGELEGYIEVELLGDAQEEPGETFTLRFSSSRNATATSESAIGTIANDDTACDAPFDKVPNPWLVNGADPLNFAHRGGVTDFPENTLYAYSEAAIAGADVLEMDVFQTKDNHLVILHDASGVGRTTNGEGRIVDLTLAEVKALDAAYWFIPGEGTRRDRPEEDYAFRGIASGDKAPPPGYSADDFRIPTLEEALARFPDKLINVELKEDDGQGDYEQQMADLLLSYGRLKDLIVASFDDTVNAGFKAVAPCIPTSMPLGQGLAAFTLFLSTGEFPEMPEHIAAQIPPDASQIGDQIPGDDPIPIVTDALVAAAHAVNMPIQVWTINTCEEMLRMIDLGVDGIMTDQPLLLESVLAQPPGERSCD